MFSISPGKYLTASMSWLWSNKTAAPCPNCKPVTPVPSLLTESELQELFVKSNGTTPEAIKQHAETLVRWMRNEAARGDLPGYRYEVKGSCFEKKLDGIEGTSTQRELKWPKAAAEKVREELGKYVPIDRLKLSCNGKCSIYFDTTY